MPAWIRGPWIHGEALPAALLSAACFGVVASFQLVKPLKNGMFVEAYGADLELLAKLANIVAAAAFVGFFGVLHRRRRRAVGQALAVLFGVAFLAFVPLLRSGRGPAVWSFYILGDLQVTSMLAALWGLATELATPDQARRLFGPIGAGGVIGGLVGSSLTHVLLDVLGTGGLLLVAAGLTGLAALGLRAAGRAGLDEAAREHDTAPVNRHVESDLEAALMGPALVRRSRYLSAIVGIVAAYEVASQLMDYQFKRLTESIAGMAETQAFLASVYLLANLLSVVTQLLLVGLLMRRAGLAATMMVLPAAILVSSVAFLAWPVLPVASLLVISDNGFNYSVQQTGRETLFAVTSLEARYRARAFVNIFVQRAGKGAGILAALALGTAGASPRMLGLATAGCALAMAVLGAYAGREFEAAVRRRPAPRRAAIRR